MRVQVFIAAVLQIAGVAVAVAAAFMVGDVAGMVVLALGLLAIGIAIEPPKPQPPASNRRES